MFKFETDSRRIKKGQTFIALKGYTVDGHDYIDEAIKNGASYIISEKDLNIPIPHQKVKNTHNYLKKILNNNYKEVIKDLKIIGITGTNGKTTSAYLTYQMLNKLGVKTAYIGTIGYYYNGEYLELDNTTPDILNIYKLLVHAQENNCKIVVMEVSAHSLSYDRLYGIKFSEIAFTNLTEDHLDYYKNMKNYLNAKLLILNKLTRGAKIIVNIDDPAYTKFQKKNHKVLTIGLNGDYKLLEYKTHPNKTDLKFKYKRQIYNVTIPLTNTYNIYNYLTMLSLVNQLGFTIDSIIKYTNNLQAPKGRCEVYEINNSFIIIDYAHTPDAVEKVINAYSKIKKRQIITIIGCGGNRDNKKRPIMGEIATKLSDYVIFTNDNPRTEDPNNIISDILKGVKTNNYEVILDRKKAINKGLNLLKKDDILLLLGKGHETYQIIGNKKIHFSEAEEIKLFMQNSNKKL